MSLKLQSVHNLKNMKEMELFAREIATQLKSKSIIGLVGEMGSGKTSFVRALCHCLGCSIYETNSPTFAIHQVYKSSILTIHHIDLYRLESEEEVESSGFWDLFNDQDSIFIIEWVDRINQSHLPLNFNYIRLEWSIVENENRLVKIYK